MNYSRKILAAAIQKDIVDRILKVDFDLKHFKKGKDRYIYKAIKKVSEKDTVTADSLKQYFDLKLSSEKEDKKKSFKRYIDKLAEKDISGVEFTLSKLEDDKRERELVRRLMHTSQRIQEGEDVDDVIEDLSETTKELSESRYDYDIHDYWGKSNFNRRKMKRKEIDQGLAGSIDMVKNMESFADPYFRRGWLPKTISIIAGSTGSGKSVLLSNFARIAVHPANALNVICLVSENRKIEFTSRLDAIMLKKNYDELYEMDVTNDEYDGFFSGAVRKGWGFLKIVKAEAKAYDANTLRETIHRVQDKYDIEVDALFVDSLDLQESVRSYHEFWQGSKQAVEDTKQLVDDLGIVYVATSQAKGSTARKDNVMNEDIAGAQEKNRYADNLCFINKKANDHLLKRMNVKVTKARDGEIDGKEVHFYHHPSKRLIPWDRMFENKVDPNEDADKVIQEMRKQQADNFNEDPNTFNLS